jgi:ribosomal protein L37E
MGELNLDKFEREYGRMLEKRTDSALGSIEEKAISGCRLTGQSGMSRSDGECRQCGLPTYIRYRRLHRHFAVA